MQCLVWQNIWPYDGYDSFACPINEVDTRRALCFHFRVPTNLLLTSYQAVIVCKYQSADAL